MNGFFMDHVQCGAEVDGLIERRSDQGTLMFNGKVPCDGAMLPIEKEEMEDTGEQTYAGLLKVFKRKFWKCHKCGREVK